MREGLRSLLRTASDRASASRLFTERRLGLYASGIALSYAMITIQLWPIFHFGRAGQHCLDFTWIWLTGKFAVSNDVARVYEPAALSAARAAFLPVDCILDPGRLDYPPTLLFFTYPLGLMPYSTAIVVWSAATLLLYLAAVYAIIPRAAAVVAALTTYPVVLNVLFGHNGFLTAGLFGLALATVVRRPWLSGIFLGLLTYKPQFGILFPFALLASRNWRVFISATATSVMFGAAAAVVFGYRLWPLFIAGLVEEAARLHDGSEWIVWFVSVSGVLRQLGVGASASWAVQLAVTTAVVVTVCVLWARPIPHSLKAASLGFGALLASPYVLSYDFCILTIAVAFLVKDGVARGFLRVEQAAILAAWVGLSFFLLVGVMLFSALTAGFTRLGESLLYLLLAEFPVIICAALFLLVVRRAVLRQPDAPATMPGLAEQRGA